MNTEGDARPGGIVDAGTAWWKVQSHRAAIIVTVVGELDAANGALLDRTLRRLAEAGGPLVVDLAAVDFCAVPCVRALAALHDDCRTRGLPLAVVADTAIRPLLDSAEFDLGLPVVASVEEALPRYTVDRRSGRRLTALANDPRHQSRPRV